MRGRIDWYTGWEHYEIVTPDSRTVGTQARVPQIHQFLQERFFESCHGAPPQSKGKMGFVGAILYDERGSPDYYQDRSHRTQTAIKTND